MKQIPNHETSTKNTNNSHQVCGVELVEIRNDVRQYVAGDIAMQRLRDPIMEYPLSADQQRQIKDVLDSAGIYKNRYQIEQRLSTALSNAMEYTKNPYKPYPYKKLTKITFGTTRPKGAHQKGLIRLHVVHTMFWVWRNAFGAEPTISRKITAKDSTTMRSPFVIFAAEILAMAKIGKPEDHLSLYRSYEDAVDRGLAYDGWIQERDKKGEKRRELRIFPLSKTGELLGE